MPILTPSSYPLPDPEQGDPKWLVFQKAVAQLKASYGDCDVIHDHKVRGRRSGIERQVDIWLSATIGGEQLTVAVECKCHETTPVAIKDVDAFYGFLDDVGANKGVLISNTGFTEGANRRADGANISVRTLTLEEAEDFEWDEYLADECHGGDWCFSTINWEHSDIEGDEAGYCGGCGSLHIKCAECGTVGAYDWDSIKCDGCDVMWALEKHKGEIEGFHRITPEPEDEEDDD